MIGFKTSEKSFKDTQQENCFDLLHETLFLVLEFKAQRSCDIHLTTFCIKFQKNYLARFAYNLSNLPKKNFPHVFNLKVEIGPT